MIERQVIVTWNRPEEKLPPVGEEVIVTISGSTKHQTYDHVFALASWYGEWGWELMYCPDLEEYVVHAWCDLEPYGMQGVRI